MKPEATVAREGYIHGWNMVDKVQTSWVGCSGSFMVWRLMARVIKWWYISEMTIHGALNPSR